MLMLPALHVPDPIPPQALKGYGLPETAENLLTWDFVDQQMTAARYYWLGTSNAESHQHAVPVWGIWYENRVYFDGSSQTRWARNLSQNPHIAVHLPDPEKVVVIEGRVQTLHVDNLGKYA